MAHYGGMPGPYAPSGGGGYGQPSYSQPQYRAFALQPPTPYEQQQIARSGLPVGARVWARLVLEGEVSWGQAIILKGLAWISASLGVCYRIDFTSRPEYGGPRVQNGERLVNETEIQTGPPRMW